MSKILAFSGSSSSKSINQQLVNAVVRRFSNIEVTVIDIRDFPLLVFSVDIEEADGIPENAERLKKLFTDHDGFIISSPEHNGSIPTIFKNLVDWLSRMGGKVFQDKPMLLMSASPGQGGGKTNLDNLLKLMPWWGGEVVGSMSIGGFSEVFDSESGDFTDTDLEDQLKKIIGSLNKVI
jgi:NAD(P)H-dependent FMN reductase